MIALLTAAGLSVAAAGTPCTAEQITDLTAISTVPYPLTCRATLQPSQAVVRPVVIRGREASGAGLDCNGAQIGIPRVPVTTSSPTIAIWSAKLPDGRWSAPRDVTIRNCTIHGAIRIWGMGADGSYDDLRTSSRTPGHTRDLQQVAPRNVRLEGLTIVAGGTIPLYIGPGVTGVSFTASTISGQTSATAVYLDAESARNTIAANRIVARTQREAIAVDGSAHNIIRDNHFDLGGQPGILLYRNCGERGVIRHQSPSHNTITGNRFAGASWLRPRLVVENARNGRRSYCRDDAGYPYGSSADDRDLGRDNIIRHNHRR